MKKLERQLLAELFFKQKEPPPRKSKSKVTHPERTLSVEEFIELLKKLPDLRRDLEEALKRLEPPKKDDKHKDGLTLGQKYLLSTLAAVFLPLLYISIIKAIF